jgi:hypothetical protein
MSTANVQQHETPSLLSFSEAARLTGMPKAYLRELAEAGQLAVRLLPGDGEPKMRLTRGGLVEAGLLADTVALPAVERDELAPLIDLIREQSTRISALEEQRFQLGAQLGAAIERVTHLEHRIAEIASPAANHIAAIPAELAPESVAQSAPPEIEANPAPAMARTLLEISDRSRQLALGMRDRFRVTRNRLQQRSRSEL